MRFLCIFFSFFSLMYIGLVTIHLLTYIVLIFLFIYDDECCSSPIFPCVISFLSLYTCFFMYVIFISVSH